MDRTDRLLTDEELRAAIRADPSWREDIRRSQEAMEAERRRGEKPRTLSEDELIALLLEHL